MNHGPHEAKLRAIDAMANKAAVDHVQRVWTQGGFVLAEIAQTLARAAVPMKGQLGTATGQAAHDAFLKASTNVQKRSAQMSDASDALLIASSAIEHTEQVRTKLDNNPLGPAPTPPATTPGSSHPDDVDKQRAYHSEKASYDAAAQQRESEAEAANTHMDARYAEASSILQKVHGQPDPQPAGPTGPTGPGGGGGGTAPGSGPRTSTGTPYYTSTGGHVLPTGGHHPPPTDGGGDPGYDPHHPTHTDDTGGGDGQSGLPATPIEGYPATPSTGFPGASVPTSGPGGPGGITGSTAGGVAGAVGGGAIGGMAGIGGAVRGPMAVPTGSSAGGASSGRIGASSRSAGVARGALGRTSGLAEDGTAGSRSGAASSARSAGGGTRGGGKAGSRGAAGGRGTGTSGGQGGKDKKDPKRKGTEFFEDEQDWVDDEGAAPGVID